MSTWTLIQVVIDIFAALGFFVIAMRMNRAPKDDPRLSRGLQLLQSKISVLEDLSDRTEVQANQLSAILEQKCREVQAKVQLAEQHVHEIRVSMDRSLEVAKIFQDKIPHQEIIERQNTLKYVQAARLAHQGVGVDEIVKRIDLPKGEIEFIAKVNREQLMFSEEQLPDWARDEEAMQAPRLQNEAYSFVESRADEVAGEQAGRLRAEMELAERQRLVENLSRLQSEMHSLDIQLARDAPKKDMVAAFEPLKVEMGPLQKLGEEFRKACEEAENDNSRASLLPPLEHLTAMIPQIFHPGAPADANPNQPPLQPSSLASSLAAVQSIAPAVEPARDAEAARAQAQAKVQAALQRAKQAVPSAPTPSPELQAARAAALAPAGETASSQPTAAALAAPGPVVRKVEFPRIDGSVR